MPGRLFIAALSVACLATPAAAQLTEVQPGARVRFEAPGVVAGKYEGTILMRTPDTLVVGGPNMTPVRVAVARITSLQISRGSSRADGAIRGMYWGVPIMTALGAVIALVAVNDNSCRNCTPVSGGEGVGFTALAAVSGAVYGAGIGALIGRERWERFDMPARTSLDIREGRMAVRLAIAF